MTYENKAGSVPPPYWDCACEIDKALDTLMRTTTEREGFRYEDALKVLPTVFMLRIVEELYALRSNDKVTR